MTTADEIVMRVKAILYEHDNNPKSRHEDALRAISRAVSEYRPPTPAGSPSGGDPR